MRKFLDPFLVAVGTQITLLILALAYNLAARAVPRWVEHGAFYVMAIILVFGLLDMAGLAVVPGEVPNAGAWWPVAER